MSGGQPMQARAQETPAAPHRARRAPTARAQPHAPDRRAPGRRPALPAGSARHARCRGHRARSGHALALARAGGRRARRRRRGPVHQPRPDLRGGRGRRLRPQVRRLHRPGSGGRLPGVHRRRGRHVALRPLRPSHGRRRDGAVRRLRGHPRGRHHGAAVAAVLPDQAPAVPRLLRWPQVRPDHHRAGHAVARGRAVVRVPGVRHRPDPPRRVAGGQQHPRRRGLRVREPAAHPVRAAPHPQLRPLVRRRAVRDCRAARWCTGTSPGSSPATRPRARS